MKSSSTADSTSVFVGANIISTFFRTVNKKITEVIPKVANINDFGKRVKVKLIEIEKPQTWLESEIKERTGLFVDSGYLHKIFTGQRNAPRIVEAIKEILDLTD